MESILYIVSFCVALSGSILAPKTKRINAVSALMLAYITILCVGSLSALILKILGLKISLHNMTTVYFIMGIVTWGYIAIKRKIQTLEIRLCDIVGLLVGTFVVCIIAIHIFTIYLHLNYNNMVDPSSHFYYAMQIVRTENISGMYFTQLHNAMLMQVIIPFLPKSWNYKAFILADCYHTLIEYFFFYGFIIYLMRNRKYNKYLPIFFSLLYWLGYPLYSFANGAYVYWAMGATLTFYVFWLLKIYEDAVDKPTRFLSVGLVVLGCFSTTMCYVQFAPIVIFSTAVIILFQAISLKKFTLNYTRIIQVVVFFCIGIAIIFGGYYFIFYRTGLNIFAGLAIGNNTSKNLELLFVMPVFYCIMYKRIREKRFDAYILCFLCFSVFHIIMILFSTLELVSSYYLFKDNYIMWGLLFIILLAESSDLSINEKKYIKHYGILGSICLLFMYTPQKQLETTDSFSIDNSIYRHNAALFVENDFRHAVADYCTNLMEYVAENYDYREDGEKVAFVGTNWYKGIGQWYSAISGQPYFFQSPINPEDIDEYLRVINADYILVYYESDAYLEETQYFDSFEKVYDTSDGFIGKVK